MNVMKAMKRIRWAAFALLLLGVACDDGKIYETYQPMEEQGSVYQLTAILRGSIPGRTITSWWPQPLGIAPMPPIRR